MRRLWLLLFFLVACGGGCGSCQNETPREVTVGHDRCGECNSVIRDFRFTAQYVAADGTVRKFDDPGCFLRSWRKEAHKPRNAFFHAYQGDRWFVARDSWLATSSQIVSPRGYNWAAFRDFGAAQEHVSRAGNGKILSFESAVQQIALTEPLPEFRVVRAPSPTMPASVDTVRLYNAECAGCHGEKGDGRGLADPTMIPQPRDFTRGKFKIRTTDPTQPATVREIEETLIRGMPGSSMPSFYFLAPFEIRALAEHTLRLAGVFDASTAKPIEVPPAPETTAELIAEGKKLYEQLGCGACHGPDGKGDGAAAAALKDEWGQPNPPRDLTSEPFRAGNQPHNVFLILTVGMPGTPMPAYAEVTDARQRWALVAYLASIRQPAPLPEDPNGIGKYLYERHWCAACHERGGKGGRVGPALDGIGKRRTREQLKSFLLNSRPEPKFYPEIPARMPQPYLTAVEADLLAQYLIASDS